ncbi:MAG: hypothetical protein NTV94_15880, partial [Planctomycetota bacterium]|nr:hypothetical protein [Planctomycetota bacterium]
WPTRSRRPPAGHGATRTGRRGDRSLARAVPGVLKRYKANLEAYCSHLQSFCAQRAMNFMTVRSDTPVDVLVLDYLRQRGVVR